MFWEMIPHLRSLFFKGVETTRQFCIFCFFNLIDVNPECNGRYDITSLSAVELEKKSILVAMYIFCF